MSDTPAGASAVIIGAGIVGNSLVHHLAVQITEIVPALVTALRERT
jgi:hypothetical protein